ncbi:MAG TPA: hypothetical protein DCE41_34445 [Cytophagales bacterium]|nr:hypothetical protein [Cytophagales bacterium]HAA17532.1 hypothetical protein [Cytophagales bacterium]HAP59440.1 hypothetical protein [Cytophagales bacterium]
MSEENTQNSNSEKENEHSENGRIENLFGQFGKHLDDLFDKAKNSGIREDVEERLEELKKSTGKVEDDFKDWRERNQDRWKETEDGMERASQIIRDGVKDIFEKLRADRKGEGSEKDDPQGDTTSGKEKEEDT